MQRAQPGVVVGNVSQPAVVISTQNPQYQKPYSPLNELTSTLNSTANAFGKFLKTETYLGPHQQQQPNQVFIVGGSPTPQPQRQLRVQLPPGATPGQQLMITTPENTQMVIVVPQGFYGNELLVNY
eukprot:c9133_g1_i2.p1 GENE.c9133_g1_i2~~c9133_g1_i2.p1  ORF type:complete len:137 (+),score=45.62 c9133_g1_i2:35-412(+)